MSNAASIARHRPALAQNAANARQIARQEAQRAKAIARLRQLRTRARAEINRLLDFLDTSDPYVQMELEENGDELDASYPESGCRAGPHPNEDDELTGDENEPSLGSGAASSSQALWSTGNNHDMEDEHDGAEPDEADNEPSAGFDQGFGADEPNLGWTVDGCMSGGLRQGRYGVVADLEEAVEPRPPQNRSSIKQTMSAEHGLGSRRVRGLTDEQTQAMKAKIRAGRVQGVGIW